MATYWRILGVLDVIASFVMTIYSWIVLDAGFLYGVLILFLSLNASVLPFTISNLYEMARYTEAAVGRMARHTLGEDWEYDTEDEEENCWKCSCGRVNADYISTCTCGKSKRECFQKTTF